MNINHRNVLNKNDIVDNILDLNERFVDKDSL